MIEIEQNWVYAYFSKLRDSGVKHILGGLIRPLCKTWERLLAILNIPTVDIELLISHFAADDEFISFRKLTLFFQLLLGPSQNMHFQELAQFGNHVLWHLSIDTGGVSVAASHDLLAKGWLEVLSIPEKTWLDKVE